MENWNLSVIQLENSSYSVEESNGKSEFKVQIWGLHDMGITAIPWVSPWKTERRGEIQELRIFPHGSAWSRLRTGEDER